MIKLNEIQAKYGEYLVDEDKLKELLVKPKPKTIGIFIPFLISNP